MVAEIFVQDSQILIGPFLTRILSQDILARGDTPSDDFAGVTGWEEGLESARFELDRRQKSIPVLRNTIWGQSPSASRRGGRVDVTVS
jgi:hypothetical protein